jgi:hypothetical protein
MSLHRREKRFYSLSQGSFAIGRDDKKVVLTRKSKMNFIGLILINPTFFVFANWAITAYWY